MSAACASTSLCVWVIRFCHPDDASLLAFPRLPPVGEERPRVQLRTAISSETPLPPARLASSCGRSPSKELFSTVGTPLMIYDTLHDLPILRQQGNRHRRRTHLPSHPLISLKLILFPARSYYSISGIGTGLREHSARSLSRARPSCFGAGGLIQSNSCLI